MPTYTEKLRDPRWQKKRLKIMERDQFTCVWCDSDDQTLNVHHKLYQPNTDPWAYDDNDLATLCEKCHQRRHLLEKRLKVLVSKMTNYDLAEVVGFAFGMLVRNTEESDQAKVVSPDMLHPDLLTGLTKSLGYERQVTEWLEKKVLNGEAVTVEMLTSEARW